MPKRFTDTDKWKKPFIRSLDAPYKLLWMYILDDCDHAGIWQVDFEVARIRLGVDVNYESALSLFKERVYVIEKFKWFLPDFIFFQYGELSEKNRLHVSVLGILSKHELGPYKPLIRGQGQEQGIGKGQGTRQGQGKPPNKLEIFESIFGDEIFLAELDRTHRGKNIQAAFEECWIHHSNTPNPPTEVWQWKQKLNTWLTIGKSNGNGHTKNNGTSYVSGLMEGVKRRSGGAIEGGEV